VDIHSIASPRETVQLAREERIGNAFSFLIGTQLSSLCGRHSFRPLNQADKASVGLK
jgi:hypothetical protein